MTTYDILISGAGPVGSALALMLAATSPEPARIALVGPGLDTGSAPAAQPPAKARTPDPRTLALNHGSRRFLESLDAWPQTSSDIDQVHVSQRHRAGRCVISSHDMGVARLGSVITYESLRQRLHERLRASGVSLICAHTPALQTVPGGLVCQLESQRLSARLAIQSDGRPGPGLRRGYHQHALLATIRASRPQAGWAFERFTREGPLALLPHPEDKSCYSLVWCCSTETLASLRDGPESAFNAALNAEFGERLGQLGVTGPRHSFPLHLHAGPQLPQARVVAIGNAAQTLHPVAGQGLNLGLRDVAQLGQALTAWLAQPNASPEAALQAFVRRRRPDRWLTIAITDTLPRVFSTGSATLEHACGLALLGLDIFSPARRLLARHLLQGLRR